MLLHSTLRRIRGLWVVWTHWSEITRLVAFNYVCPFSTWEHIFSTWEHIFSTREHIFSTREHIFPWNKSLLNSQKKIKIWFGGQIYTTEGIQREVVRFLRFSIFFLPFLPSNKKLQLPLLSVGFLQLFIWCFRAVNFWMVDIGINPW